MKKRSCTAFLAAVLSSSLAVAQEAAPVQTKAPGMGDMFFPIALSMGIVYLLIIRPQQKRDKEMRKKIEAIEKGDEVLTKGGLIGKVTNVAEKILTVEIADKIRVRIDREFVQSITKAEVKTA